MCLTNLRQVKIGSIGAYKVMYDRSNGVVVSMASGDRYVIGEEYEAKHSDFVDHSLHYNEGFHSFVNLEYAISYCNSFRAYMKSPIVSLAIVRVQLRDVFFEGIEQRINRDYRCFVSKFCRFDKLIDAVEEHKWIMSNPKSVEYLQELL